MKLNRTDFGRKCQFPLILALGSVPAGVILLAHSLPQIMWIMAVYPVVYALMAELCILIPGKKRVFFGILFALMLLASSVLLPLGKSFVPVFVPILYAFLLLAGLNIGGWPREKELAVGWPVAGTVAHCIAQITVNLSHNLDVSPYTPAEVPLVLFFIGFLLLVMLSLNRGSMDSASMGRQRVPTGMRRRNTVFTIIVLMVVLGLSALPAIIQAVNQLWDWFVAILYRIYMFLNSLLPVHEELENDVPRNENAGAFDMSAAPETNPLAELLEKIFYVIAIAVAVVLIALLARFLYKKLKIVIRWLLDKLSQYAASASEDYEDEITDTREDGERERNRELQRLRRKIAHVDEKTLTPVQRIRYRYLRQWMKHPDWHVGRTARENLPESTAALYERARYSEHPVTEADAARFTEEIKNI